jgi:hypothetical protein
MNKSEADLALVYHSKYTRCFGRGPLLSHNVSTGKSLARQLDYCEDVGPLQTAAVDPGEVLRVWPLTACQYTDMHTSAGSAMNRLG